MNSFRCLLCEVTGPAERVSDILRDDASGRFRVFRCLTCGHLQLFRLPTMEEETEFYRIDNQARTQTGKPEMELWRQKTALDTVRRIAWVRSLSSDPCSILDIGCGYGFFVDGLTQLTYQALGIDINEERLELARSTLQGKFLNAQIDEVFIAKHQKSYDIVTVFHVLEHLRQPVAFLRDCTSLLAPGGYLLIEVPNANDALVTENKAYRAFYWQRAHLSYFDATRLELGLRRAGLRKFDIRGIQRYGLRNLIHWLDEGRPQLFSPSFETSEPILNRLEQLYRADRERALTCDTLIAEVQK